MRTLWVIALLMTAGCVETAERDRDAPTGEIENIVESLTPLWEEGQEWRLGAAPVVEIGEGNEEYQLFRVVGAVRLTDGRIVVANAGTHELRFYDQRGVYLSSSGGQGQGPGEFESLFFLQRLPGDSLLTYDLRNRRFSVFDSAGRHLRSLPVHSGLFAPNIIGRIGDDSYFAFVTTAFRRALDMATGSGPRAGLTRDSLYLLRFTGEMQTLDTLGVFPAIISEVKRRNIGGRETNTAVPVAYSPTTVAGRAPDHLLIGTSDTYEIRVLDPAGELQSVIRRTFPLVRTGASDRQAYIDRMERELGDDPELADVLAMDLDVEMHPTLPAYLHINVDHDDNLWVTRYRVRNSDQVIWDVFDANGRLLGNVEGPGGLRILDVGPSYVMGLWEDANDVEFVRLYDLSKIGGP